jgi:peptidoglycan/LPS O-acetylase OafA/YrhL
MLQGAIGTPDLDGSFWTLWTEARFYVILAVFIVVGITRQRVVAFATLWPVLGTIVAHTHNSLLSTLLIADYAPYFAGGMLLYVIYRDGHDLGTWLLVGVQSLFAAVFAAGHYPLSIANTAMWPASQAVVAVISFACFGLVALVTLTRISRHSARWMTFLGALTYPLYLVHQKVGLYVIHLVHGDVSPWAAMGAAALLSLSLAIVLHLAVEKPLGGRLRLAMLQTLRQTGTDSGVTITQPAVRQLTTPFPRNGSPLNPMIGSEGTGRRAVRDVRAPLTASAVD